MMINDQTKRKMIMKKSVFAMSAAAVLMSAVSAQAFTFDLGGNTNIIVQGNSGQLAEMCATAQTVAAGFGYDEASRTFTTDHTYFTAGTAAGDAAIAQAVEGSFDIDIRINDADDDGAYVILPIPAAGLAGATLAGGEGEIFANSVGSNVDVTVSLSADWLDVKKNNVTEGSREQAIAPASSIQLKNLEDGARYDALMNLGVEAVHPQDFTVLSNTVYEVALAQGCVNTLP
jgi:hypothetical protein